MKTLVAILLLVIAGLSSTIYVQSRTNASLNAQVVALNQEIRPLRTSEELMLSLSNQNKEWEEAVRPVVETACKVRGCDPAFCEGIEMIPDQFRSAAVVWAAAVRR